MSFSIQQLYRNSVALVCVAFVVVLTVCLTLVFYLHSRENMRETLTLQARMVAVALSDTDMANASNSVVIPALDAGIDLVLACVYDHSGVLRATRQGVAFGAKGVSKINCSFAKRYDSLPGKMLVRADIVRRNLPEAIGEVILVGRSATVLKWVPASLAIAVLAGLVLALVCWHFGLKLHRNLIKPIRQIGSTAQRVSLYKDYTLRVVPGALDDMPYEIRSLTESFNAMLKEIEDRDSRLSRKSGELDRARATAESANQAKSQFLANVSHELRTPLNAIIGFSTMLGDEKFGPMGNPKYVEYAQDIHASGKHLLDVINDILDLTKAETGKLSVVFGSVSLPKIIEKALRIVSGQAHERKIDIYTDLPEKLPKIIADPVRLVQILLNLLSNAIKFTNEGGKIVVRARAEPARQGIHYFTIVVEDNGIGMTEANIRKAFSTFNQAEMGLNRKYEGAGLGLPLTKRLVELHHGKIKIESVLGEGTVVTVRLTSDPALLD